MIKRETPLVRKNSFELVDDIPILGQIVGVCRIRPGWVGAGREGRCFGKFWDEDENRYWVIVKWPEEDDPDLYKEESLIISNIKKFDLE